MKMKDVGGVVVLANRKMRGHTLKYRPWQVRFLIVPTKITALKIICMVRGWTNSVVELNTLDDVTTYA
jgi:hypothetical protein